MQVKRKGMSAEAFVGCLFGGTIRLSAEAEGAAPGNNRATTCFRAAEHPSMIQKGAEA